MQSARAAGARAERGSDAAEKRDSVAPPLFSEKKWGRLRISNFLVLFFSPPSLPSDSTTPPSLIPRAKRLIHLSIRGPREIQSASLFLFSLNTETLKRRFGREKATSKQARPAPSDAFAQPSFRLQHLSLMAD